MYCEVDVLDKYELTIKIDKLDKLVKNRDYVNAAKVADQLEWKKMKQWSVMSNAIDAFVATGNYEKARNVCVYAYNRKLGGRRLLATLMEMYVKLEEFDDAQEIYQEYVELAPRDVIGFILLYKLRRAQGAPVEELINILQNYKEKELDEEYEYELALLYSKAGLTDKCVRECDDLVLWFSDGIYVEKALKLKQVYAPLTPRQEAKLAALEKMSAAVSDNKDLDDEAENEKEPESSMAYTQAAAYEEPEYEPEDSSMEDESEADEADEDSEEEPVFEPVKKEKKSLFEWGSVSEKKSQKAESDKVQEKEEKKFVDDIENTTQWTPINPEKTDFSDSEDVTDVTKEPQPEQDYDINIKVPDYSVYDTRNVQQELKANVNEIMEAYHNREKKEALREAAQLEDIQEDSDPTKEIIINKHQWRKASRNNAAPVVSAAGDVKPVRQQPIDGLQVLAGLKGSDIREVTQQMTLEQMEDLVAQLQAEQERRKREAKAENSFNPGRMDISQWISDADDSEDKPAKADRSVLECATREIPVSEIRHRMETKKEEHAPEIRKAEEVKKETAHDAADIKEAAPESEDVKQIASEMSYAEYAAPEAADARDTVSEVSYDKHVVSETADAKPTVSELPYAKYAAPEAADIKEAAPESEDVKEIASEMAYVQYTSPETDDIEQIKQTDAEDVERAEREALERTVREIAASFEKAEAGSERKSEHDTKPEPEDIISDNINDEDAQEYRADDSYDYEFEEIPDVEDSQNDLEPDDEELPDLEKAINAGIEQIIDDNAKALAGGSESGRYVLKAEEKAFLDRYLYMSGMERRLCRYIGSKRAQQAGKIENAGNIAIMGSRNTDKIAFAVNLFKALHVYDANREQKLARISADRINERGYETYADKLIGQTLVVENAGRLKREALASMMKRQGDTLFIIIDEEFEINKLFAENPDFSDEFTGCFLLKQYTVNELVDIAKDYAEGNSWRVEDKALLKLYLILSRIPNDDQGNVVELVKNIMNHAAEHAKSRIGNKLFGKFRAVLVIKEGDLSLDDEYEEEDEEILPDEDAEEPETKPKKEKKSHIGRKKKKEVSEDDDDAYDDDIDNEYGDDYDDEDDDE